MAERSVLALVRRAHRSSPAVVHVLLAVSSSVLVVLALLGAELASRWWAPGYLVETRGLHVFSGAYGWKGRPGAVAPMGDGSVSLNALGYRGRELSLPKPGDRTRVVVLGDSVAFGYGVSDEETFPHLLDVRDNGIEAGNLAVQGYGPGQELLVLRREGLRADPDVVVLAVCLRNDFVDAVLPVELYDGVTPRPRFRLVGGALVLDDARVRRGAARRGLQWLSDQSHLFNRLTALLPLARKGTEHTWRHRKREVLRDSDYALRLTSVLIVEMARACRRQGVAFLAATFPSGLSYEMKRGLPERLHRALKAEGVWLVDMERRFQTLGLAPSEVTFDTTGHLSPRGHGVVCEILEREIAARFAPARAAVGKERGTPEAKTTASATSPLTAR